MMKTLVLAVLATLALGACTNGPKAPTNARICYHMAKQTDGEWRFNVVAREIKTIELCAVELERMRLSFLRLGGDQTDIVGTYGGQFVFLNSQGVFVSRTFKGTPYLLLRRHSGNLVFPGIIEGA